MTTSLRLLIVEDSPDDAALLLLELRRAGYAPAWRRVETAEDMRAALACQPWDIILCDYVLPQFDAMAALQVVGESHPDLPLVVVSGAVGEDAAVEVMRRGADDYLFKRDLTRLVPVIERGLREAKKRQARRTAEVAAAAERRRMIEELKRNSRLLRAVADNIPDAMFVKDRTGKYLLLNEAAARFVGRGAEEVLGQDDTALFDAAGARLLQERDRQVMESAITQVEEEELTAAGTTRVFQASKTPYRDENGQVIGLIGISRDVTAQKQVEKALRESEQAYRTLLDRMPDPLFVYSCDTLAFVTVNDAAIASYGYGRSELLAMTLVDILAPEDPPGGAAMLARMLEGGEKRDVWQHRKKDGTIIDVEIAAHHTVLGGMAVCVTLARDITDRRRAELKLQLRDRAIQSVTSGILITDPSLPDNPIIYASAGFERMTGYSQEDAVGKNCRFLQGKDTDPAAVAQIRAAVGDGIACDVELVNYRKDGTAFWNQLLISPVRDEQGKLTHFVGVQTDVTERKKTALALQASEERYRTLVAATAAFVWDTTASGDFEWEQPQWTEFTGQPLAQLREWGWLSAVHPDDRDNTVKVWKAALSQRTVYQVEHRLRRADGEYRNMCVRAVPMLDRVGAIREWVGVHTDVTDVKRAEAERAELLAMLNLQIDRMPLAYLLTGPDFRYTRWNPAAERMFGFAEKEILGKHPFDVIVPPRSQPVCSKVFEQLRAGDMDAHGSCENVTKSGQTILCEWHNTPLMGPNGTFLGILSLAQDITEKRLLEEQFRQAQKMEAVGRLAGGVAHDFNNLLTVINGYGDIVAASLPGGHPAANPVAQIKNAGERAAMLTRQLLAFSRKTVLEPKILDLNAQVRDMATLLRRLIGEDIELTTALDLNLGRVKADPGQLEQAIINLCVNARDAMPQGGKITIETQNVELDETYAEEHADVQAGSYVLLAVTDSGHGMDPATKTRIFEPFFTTKDQGKGTGLGLAMVYGFIKQSSGHITVYSEPGCGATFKLYLPRIPASAAPPKSPPGPNSMPRGSETLLLVEDEAGVRALARHVLQSCGYTILEAADGREALRIARQNNAPIQLLVTDVVMPHLDGRQAAEAVLALHPQAKVLFLSGYTDDAVVRHGVLEANTSFLQKPFTPMALALKVREVLDQGGLPPTARGDAAP